MKLIDSVKKAIFSYPSIFLCGNFEDSMFNVLHHYFVVLGNGMAWANPKNPANGGYLTKERLVKKHGEWVRRPDADYGTQTFQKDIDDLFWEKRYVVVLKLKPLKTIIVQQSELPKYANNKSYLIQNERVENPYPNFTKHNVFREDAARYIKADWREAALGHFSYWLEYFADDERVKNYFFYKSDVWDKERLSAIDSVQETIRRLSG
jgi:hypothetical protein